MSIENPANVTPFELLGLDIPRHWVTGMQAFKSDDHMIVVLREQMHAEIAEGEAPLALQKNVASFAMPLVVAKEFRDLLVRLFPEEDGASAVGSDGQQ